MTVDSNKPVTITCIKPTHIAISYPYPPPFPYFKPHQHTKPYYPSNPMQNLPKILETIQNAIAQEINNGETVVTKDLQKAAQMAMLQYSRLSENDQAVVREQLERPINHQHLRTQAPKWYKETITDYHE